MGTEVDLITLQIEYLKGIALALGIKVRDEVDIGKLVEIIEKRTTETFAIGLFNLTGDRILPCKARVNLRRLVFESHLNGVDSNELLSAIKKVNIGQGIANHWAKRTHHAGEHLVGNHAGGRRQQNIPGIRGPGRYRK